MPAMAMPAQFRVPAVKQEVLQRARRRVLEQEEVPVLSPTPPAVAVPLAWLERCRSVTADVAGRGDGHGRGEARASDPLGGGTSGARRPASRWRHGTHEEPAPPAVAPLALQPWLARLEAADRAWRLMRAAQEERSEESAREREALQKVRAQQSVVEHCRESVAFLRGPRQLRDRFGSVQDGTDRTYDVVLQANMDLRDAGKELIADLCRATREARRTSPGSPREGLGSSLPPSPRLVRRRAKEAIKASGLLLQQCGVEVHGGLSDSESDSSVSSSSRAAGGSPATPASAEAIRREATLALRESAQLLLECKARGMDVGSFGPGSPDARAATLASLGLAGACRGTGDFDEGSAEDLSRSEARRSTPASVSPTVRACGEDVLWESEQLLRRCGFKSGNVMHGNRGSQVRASSFAGPCADRTVEQAELFLSHLAGAELRPGISLLFF